MSVADNIKKIRELIAEAAVKSGAAPGSVRLVAASKTQPASAVREAILAGVDAVGENRVQEMLAKNEEGAYLGAPLHFIGRLQSNKVNKVVGLCGIIESVDSISLLETIGRRAEALGITQEALFEVNIGRESSKSGVLPEALEEILEATSKIRGVFLSGLMAIPPNVTDSGGNHSYFDAMYKLFVDMMEKKYDNVSMRLLSMGMSASFYDAVLSGANMVRVGSGIFGDRL